ncbi:Zinc-regulated transporter 3 [Kluyveromyces marxianus]
MDLFDSGTVPKWLLYSMSSSFLCIFGAFMVPIVYSLFRSSEEVNTKLLNYGLSLSAGSMLCTSLLKMLGSTDRDNDTIVFLGFLIGCFISFFLNHIVHSYTSQSLIHCAHSDNDDGELVMNSYDSAQFYDTTSHSHRASHNHSIKLPHSYDHAHLHGHTQARGRYNSLEGPNADQQQQQQQQQHQSHFHPQPQHHHASFSHTNALHTHDNLENINETLPLLANNSTNSPTSPIDQDQEQESQSFLTALRPKKCESTNTEYDEVSCIPIVKSVSRSSLPISKCGGEIKQPALCIEPNIGYDLENLNIYREQFKMRGDTSMDAASGRLTLMHDDDHKHVMETPFSKLISIGIQTCLVICLHKFPEGFIIFYTNNPNDVDETRPDLGFSIFLSLAVHNFIEGFAMTLPLFTAFETKWHALLITIVLGGGSQPLGALLGLEWYKHSNHSNNPESTTAKMDFLLSVTSGFLFVISLQMFQTAVAFSDTHHHHEGEDDSTIRAHHSSGTTCLKYCCLGVLLILASSALKSL